VGLSLRSVQRIWQAHRLQSHRLRTFKRSRAPAFAAKLADIVGLYIDPPAHAVVLSLDTTILFAALSMLDGIVIGRYMERHRHMEFIRLHNAVEREVRAEKPIHGARQLSHRQASQSAAWLSRDPRWTFHFIPISASWLNAIENFFILDHSPTHSPQRLPFDCRLPGRHQCLSRRAQCQSQTLRLDQVRRRDPCQTRPPTCMF
jgi:hypothetical protein